MLGERVGGGDVVVSVCISEIDKWILEFNEFPKCTLRLSVVFILQVRLILWGVQYYCTGTKRPKKLCYSLVKRHTSESMFLYIKSK